MSESQATSAEARSCCETGEELLRESFLPLDDKMEQLPRLAKKPLPLRTAELVRRHGPRKAMAGRIRAVWLDQPTTLGQGRQLASQPAQHPPDGAMVQKPARFPGGSMRWISVDPPPASRAGRLTIGLPVVLQVAGAKMNQGRAGVALIGEYESRDNR